MTYEAEQNVVFSVAVLDMSCWKLNIFSSNKEI